MHNEIRDEPIHLPNMILELQKRLDLIRGKTRDFLFWQLGAQILLGSYFNSQIRDGLVFWIRDLAYLIIVLAVMIWLFSSHHQTVLYPIEPFQEQKPETQAAMHNQLLTLEQQIHSWNRHTFGIRFLGWLGILLHGAVIMWFC
ncbi:MAG: hypothetical protein RLZZ156_796 [Deinococcota bacterium]|jgi:hypothetical protein